MVKPDRKRNRLVGYNYSREGLYFVTSCVQDKACVFGYVADGEMVLNKYGQIAETQWHWLAEQYPYVVLHVFVVMPNHVHAILEIDQGFDTDLYGKDSQMTAKERFFGNDSDRSRPVPTRKIKSISELMGVYKTTTSKLIRQAGLNNFAWQRSFHDHIIRHERAYRHIMQYILNNPALWQEDVFYQESLS
ncbi:transposase [uncultured Pontibacter sp.]|uniref:transposase n=1 Tax=uncultured Pontibacter sp. TaxID=453356 RepID=UPI0026292FB3|nr:transposase [uncultured Pontibacter sp.]